jgi:hypothetical protein
MLLNRTRWKPRAAEGRRPHDRVFNRYLLGEFIKNFLLTPRRVDVRDVRRRGGAGHRLHVARHLGWLI